MQIVVQSVIVGVRRCFQTGATIVCANFDGSTKCTWAREGTDAVPHCRTWTGVVAQSSSQVSAYEKIAKSNAGMGPGATGTLEERAHVKAQLADQNIRVMPTHRHLPASVIQCDHFSRHEAQAEEPAAVDEEPAAVN